MGGIEHLHFRSLEALDHRLAGCPNRLFFPALKMTAAGLVASMNASLLEVALPWWAAFRMTSGPSARPGISASSTSLPMSPGSRIDTSWYRTSRTTESSFLTRCRSQSGRRRMQHANLHRPGALDVAGTHGPPDDLSLLRTLVQLLQDRVRRHRNAFPHIGRTKPLEHDLGATDVVRVAMGQDQRVQPRDAQCAQCRHEDTRADIEGRARETAGVHQHGIAARRDDERRVSLADVEDDDAKTSRLRQRDQSACRETRPGYQARCGGNEQRHPPRVGLTSSNAAAA